MNCLFGYLMYLYHPVWDEFILDLWIRLRCGPFAQRDHPFIRAQASLHWLRACERVEGGDRQPTSQQASERLCVTGVKALNIPWWHRSVMRRCIGFVGAELTETIRNSPSYWHSCITVADISLRIGSCMSPVWWTLCLKFCATQSIVRQCSKWANWKINHNNYACWQSSSRFSSGVLSWVILSRHFQDLCLEKEPSSTWKCDCTAAAVGRCVAYRNLCN